LPASGITRPTFLGHIFEHRSLDIFVLLCRQIKECDNVVTPRIMAYYTKSWLTVAFFGGVLMTLAFKDFYPDLEHRFRQRKRTKSRGAHFLEDRVEEDEDNHEGVEAMRSMKSITSVKLEVPPIREGIEGCIGNTPLIKIKSLSDATGCDILAKAEVTRLNALSKLVIDTCIPKVLKRCRKQS